MGMATPPTKVIWTCTACGHVEPDTTWWAANKCQLCQAPLAASVVPLETLAAAGNRTDAGLACPQCGGTQFRTKRSGRWKGGLAGGVALTALTGGLAAPVLIASAATAKPTRVVCVTCGSVFVRGV
jgi:hypothetical protein